MFTSNKEKMPLLVHKGVTIENTLNIAEYIERAFPHSSLTKQGAFSYQEILERTEGFYPALSAYIKNKDEMNDDKLQEKLEDQLDILEEILQSTPGQYICGTFLTLADLYLLPQLYHTTVTLEHFKGIQFFDIEGNSRLALQNYLSQLMDMEEFKDPRVYYNADEIIYGWKKERGEV